MTERPIAASSSASATAGLRRRRLAGAQHRRVGLAASDRDQPDGTLIAGERRLRACESLGWTAFRSRWSISTTSRAASLPRTPSASRSCRARSRRSAGTLEPVERRRRRSAERRRQAWGKFPKTGQDPRQGRRRSPASPVAPSRRSRRSSRPPRQSPRSSATSSRTWTGPGASTARTCGWKVRQAEASGRAAAVPGQWAVSCGLVRCAVALRVDGETPSLRAPLLDFPQCRSRRSARSMSRDDARGFVLWMWSTNFHMRYAFTCSRRGDSKHRRSSSGGRIGRPWAWLRGQTEPCILAVRGNPVVTLTDQTTLFSRRSASPLGASPSSSMLSSRSCVRRRATSRCFPASRARTGTATATKRRACLLILSTSRRSCGARPSRSHHPRATDPRTTTPGGAIRVSRASVPESNGAHSLEPPRDSVRPPCGRRAMPPYPRSSGLRPRPTGGASPGRQNKAASSARSERKAGDIRLRGALGACARALAATNWRRGSDPKAR